MHDNLAHIDHPNIVAINSFYYTNEHFWIRMSLEEHSLSSYLRSNKLLYEYRNDASQNKALKERFVMAVDIVAAVDYLHSRNPPIIHMAS
jgi:serine/threonine protein kinase